MEPEKLGAMDLGRTNGPVILCVDDDPGVLNALRRSLRGDPYEVITARGSDEALGWLDVLAVDLVITDERMPGMSGTELLLEVRKRSPRTARAILTGYGSSEVIRKGLEAGADTFLYKPWADRVLRETVDRILKKSSKVHSVPPEHLPAPGNFDLGGEGG